MPLMELSGETQQQFGPLVPVAAPAPRPPRPPWGRPAPRCHGHAQGLAPEHPLHHADLRVHVHERRCPPFPARGAKALQKEGSGTGAGPCPRRSAAGPRPPDAAMRSASWPWVMQRTGFSNPSRMSSFTICICSLTIFSRESRSEGRGTWHSRILGQEVVRAIALQGIGRDLRGRMAGDDHDPRALLLGLDHRHHLGPVEVGVVLALPAQQLRPQERSTRAGDRSWRRSSPPQRSDSPPRPPGSPESRASCPVTFRKDWSFSTTRMRCADMALPPRS